jgi:hypothetical protein
MSLDEVQVALLPALRYALHRADVPGAVPYPVTRPGSSSGPLASPAAARPERRAPARLAAAVMTALLVIGGGCRRTPAPPPPPTEELTRIAVDGAPVLNQIKPGRRPYARLFEGELVRVVERRDPFDWTYAKGGEVLRRSSRIVALRRASGQIAVFGFEEDLGPSVRVPTAEHLCAVAGAAPECPRRLQRVALGDGLFAWEACGVGPCRAIFARGGAISSTTIDGLTLLDVATIGGRRVAVATSRWVRTPEWTGAEVVVVELAPGLARLATVATEDTDARGDVVRQRAGALERRGDAFVLKGVRREVAKATAAVVSEAPFEEPVALRRE